MNSEKVLKKDYKKQSILTILFFISIISSVLIYYYNEKIDGGLEIVFMPNALIGTDNLYNHPELRAKEFEQLTGEEKFRTKILGLEMEMTSSPGTTTTKIVEKSIRKQAGLE